MPVFEIGILVAVVAIFGLFGLSLAYVNMIAGDRAITPEEEHAARAKGLRVVHSARVSTTEEKCWEQTAA